VTIPLRDVISHDLK